MKARREEGRGEEGRRDYGRKEKEERMKIIGKGMEKNEKWVNNGEVRRRVTIVFRKMIK